MTELAGQRIVRPAMTQKMRLQTQFAGDREQVQCRRGRNRRANLRAAMKFARTIEKHRCKHRVAGRRQSFDRAPAARRQLAEPGRRSEEYTSELQSLMRNSYAVFCL